MKKRIYPISMAVLWGMVFGTALQSRTMGVCMGLMMGMAFGLFDSGPREDRDPKQGRRVQRLPGGEKR